MSADKNTELLELIDDIVAKNTFSLEALGSIKALKDEVLSLEKSNKALINVRDLQQEEIQKLTELVRERFDKITDLEQKLNKLKEQEEKAKEAIYIAEKEKAVAFAYREAMQIVFKPNVIRETVARSKTYTTDSGMYRTDTSNETKTIDEGM